MAGFCLWHGAQNRAYAETLVLKAPAAEKTHSQYGLLAAIRCALNERPLWLAPACQGNSTA